MINLAVSKKSESERLKRVRQMTVMVTSLFLGLYIVVVSGFLGWWWFLGSREQQSSLEVTQLEEKVGGKSEEEVMVRSLAARANEIEKFIGERVVASEVAELFRGVPVTTVGWSWDLVGGKQSVSVTTTEAEDVDRFMVSLGSRFTRVRLETVSWGAKEGYWTGVVSLGGLKR